MPEHLGKFTTGDIRRIIESGDKDKIVEIPEEELLIFYENERQRELFSPEGIKSLYAGICEAAVRDYKDSRRIRMFFTNHNAEVPQKAKAEGSLEKFLGSEFFLNVTGLPSKEYFIRAIDQTLIEERKRRLRKTMV